MGKSKKELKEFYISNRFRRTFYNSIVALNKIVNEFESDDEDIDLISMEAAKLRNDINAFREKLNLFCIKEEEK